MAAREPIIPRGAYLTVGNPIKLSNAPADIRRSPLLGEHTAEIKAAREGGDLVAFHALLTLRPSRGQGRP